LRRQQVDERFRAVDAQRGQRAQEFQEAAFQRQLPLSELNALRTGGQPTAPQFQAIQGANVQAAPLFNAAVQGGNFANQQFDQRFEIQQANVQGLTDLFSSVL